ncbi:MAG: protein translocase subunit SecD [Bacilli bacterium]|nr:protein translocase subunit SecD [Bacilli bacterium]
MNKGMKVIKKLGIVVVIIAALAAILFPLLKDYKFGLDLQGGFEVLYEVKSLDGTPVTKDMVTSTYKTIAKRIDVLGVSEPSIIVEGDDRIRVQLAGVTDKEEARNILSKAATLSFRDTSDQLLMAADVLKAGGAKVGQDQYNKPVVSLSVQDKDEFYNVTKKVSEKSDNRIVIWLDFDPTSDSFAKNGAQCGSLNDSRCLSVATVSQGFASDVIIQGNFKEEEVKTLVELINSGSLPTKLEEVSSKTVAASFGQDSLNRTFTAGIIGISLILIFLIAIYRFAGFIAALVLGIYSFVTLFVFWLVGGVLTLPGIAAMVIGIGMAADSTVINYARIKDELFKGNSLKQACKMGNKSSLKSIVDANLTTLIAAFILFIFGETSIKGFATMLIISTFVTMIIMVALSRKLMKMFVDTEYFDEKLNLFIGVRNKDVISSYNKNPKSLRPFEKIDFVKMKGKIYVITVFLAVIGIISLCTQGLVLGVDFKGGTSITMQTAKELTKQDIAKDLKTLKLTDQSIEFLKGGTIAIKVNETLNKNNVAKAEKYFNEKYQAKTDIGVVSDVVKQELIKNAFLSVILASLGIIIYVSFRFKFNYAVSGVAALLHDTFMIIAFFSLFKFEVSSIFIAAILSIIGYSINDTIVTFDRTREVYENKKKVKTKEDLAEVVNEGLRSTLTRSIITTMTTLIPVICLVIFGSHEIINFNIALLVGLVAGVYSSIFIASCLWYDMEKKNLNKKTKQKWYEEKEVEEFTVKGVNG